MSPRALATIVALPPLAAFGSWIVMLAVATTTGRHPIWNLEAENLAESVAMQNAVDVLRRIERGEDPDQPGEVRAGLVLPYAAVLTPIEAAAAAREGEMAHMLLNLGARPDAATWQRAWCISDASGVRDALDAYRPAGASDECAAE